MTCTDTPADLAFAGFLGRAYRRVSARPAELRIATRAGETVLTPAPEDWADFWSTVDALAAWDWTATGTSIKDGAPWRLQLAHGGRGLEITGNGAEDHAPAGFRRFCLALDELADRTLLSDDERGVLDAGFQLVVTVTMPEPRPRWRVDQHPTKQALEAVLAGAQLKSTSYRGERVGWTWVVADPSVLRAAVSVLDGSPDQPEAELRDFTTGVVEPLWPNR